MELTKKILIADTGEEFRRSFIDNLNNEPDIQVVGETGDGEELLRMVQETTPDLILMEIVLAKMDGIEVLDALNDLELEHPPKIIILSSFARTLRRREVSSRSNFTRYTPFFSSTSRIVPSPNIAWFTRCPSERNCSSSPLFR